MNAPRARPHPFDLVFGPVADEWFGALRALAGDRPLDLPRFAALEPVEGLVGQMQPEGAPAELGDEYLRLLFAAYVFWREGRKDRTATREGISAARSLGPGGALPPATYVRLPENRYWGRAVADGAPEPIDGFFVVHSPERSELLVLAVLGLRAARAGFSQVSALVSAGDFLKASSPRADPLAPDMAGAKDMESVTSLAELLWLARLALFSADG